MNADLTVNICLLMMELELIEVTHTYPNDEGEG
jgi:hypothetical protein